ncbi:MAG: N-6 DNA methylase [Muribaculaceae bacterium]|nr:N-6 DNA methylase [Muribaculaceae bacterium]
MILHMPPRENLPNILNIPLSQLSSEADVENKVIIPLFKQIGLINSESDYKLRDPVRIQAGHQVMKKQADIVIYKNGQPYIAIEAKRPEARIDDDAIGQLDSYAMWLPAKFGVACDGIKFILRGYFEGNERVYLVNKPLNSVNLDLISSVLCEGNISRLSEVSRHVIQEQSDSFSSLLKQIHQDIRDIDKLDPTNAFDEWSKLLFMKINEERWSNLHDGNRRLSYARFKEEVERETGLQYIENLFAQTCNNYPNIFSTTDKINLSIAAIDSILKKFDGYFINEIPMDVKGRAYEIFLSSTFRGKGLGQFFTPRQVVEFMIELVDINLNTILLDPACGTGGFLINGFQKIRTLINQTPDSVFASWGRSKEQFLENVKSSHIFGVDAEPRATKTAKMNMIMWGDGENVVRGNGLDSIDINGNHYPYQNQNISLILANPPFGNKEKDESILNKYALHRTDNIVKTECLFIEKALNELAPDGELAIVIPDGVLGCQPTVCVRKLIKDQALIKAVISLPKHTFAPSGVPTISTSVLYIKKYCAEFFSKLHLSHTEEEIENLKARYGYIDYNIFMAVANQIGYDPNGSASRSGINDLDDILASYRTAQSHNLYIGEQFHEISDKAFVINSKLLESRIDARYYWFNNLLSKRQFEYVELGDYIEKSGVSFSPKDFAPSETFSIVSVTNTLGIILDEDDEKKFEVEGRNITKSKIVHTGDIAYNPYRINVGSIGIVGEEFDGLLISPSYVVFRTTNGLDAKVLCALLKNDFYNTYIDIYGIGTIRTSLSFTKLKKLKIPRALVGDIAPVNDAYEKITRLKEQIRNVESEMQNNISSFLS